MEDAELEPVLARLVDHVAEVVVVFDETATVRFTNRSVERVLGYRPGEWLGRSGLDILHPDDVAMGLELLVSPRATGSGVKEPVVYRVATASGDWLPMEIITSNVELPSGELALVVSARPAAATRPASAVVGEVGQRLAQMFDQAAIGMTQTGVDERILRANQVFADFVGRDRHDLVGVRFTELLHADDVDIVRDGLARLTSGGLDTFQADVRYDLDGRMLHVSLTASLVRDRFGTPLYWATQTVDLTELKALQADLLHESTHDSLTGLANRALLERELDFVLAAGDTDVVVLYVDLDGFKQVNDSFGHSAGDAVLVGVAGRLQLVVRSSDLVARLGGDEFVIVCPRTPIEQALQLADRVVEGMAAPFPFDGGSAQVAATVGVATSHDGRPGRDELLRRADAALYVAKRSTGARIARFDEREARPVSP